MTTLAEAADGVVNLYRAPSHRAELVSQFLLGTVVGVTAARGPWRRVELPDGYAGWSLASALSMPVTASGKSGRTRPAIPLAVLRVQDFEAWIRRDRRDESPLVTAVVHGTHLSIAEVRDGWCRAIVPGGRAGWIRRNALVRLSAAAGRKRSGRSVPELRRRVARIARGYLGCPYLWGGTTPRGFDCSGLVQRVFALAGVTLPRDAWMQRRAGRIVRDPAAALTGDLYFFGRSRDRVSHVAIALGKGRFIHAASDRARGRVAVESLAPGAGDFAADLVPFLIDARRVIAG